MLVQPKISERNVFVSVSVTVRGQDLNNMWSARSQEKY